MPICTLLTDFGLADYYVAAVKGVLLSLVEDLSLVDITHDVDPGDVEAAAFLLAAALPSFPPGTVHLAVVDPGVGSDRRLLAAKYREQWIVAPDNGLASPFVEEAETRSVEREDLYRAAPGSTFHGRDRFAPIAAFLLTGGAPEQLGSLISDPERLSLPLPCRDGADLLGTVRHIDRYGNLVTDIPSAWLERPPHQATVGGLVVDRYASHYAQVGAGETVLIPGSLGTLELSKRDGNLAADAGIERGARVRISSRR